MFPDAARDMNVVGFLPAMAPSNEDSGLHPLENRFQQILEITSDGVFEWHIPSGNCFFSAQFYTMLGYDAGEFSANYLNWRERLHPDDLDSTLESLKEHLANPDAHPFRLEFRMRHKDGSWKWVLARGKVIELLPDGSPSRMIGMHVDITERKLAQERYRQLFDNLTTGFALHEAILDETGRMVDYRFLEVNPAYEKVTGLKARDIVGRRVLEVLPGLEDAWVDMFGKVVATGEPLRFENHVAMFNRWYETWAYRPTPGQFAVIVTEITERKHQESALQRSEEHFRFLAENSIDIVLRLTTTGEYLWASPSLKSILGVDPQAIVGTSALAKIHPDDFPALAAALEAVVHGTGPQKVVYRHQMDSGRIVWLESIGKVVRNPQTGEATEILVSSRDVTDRKEAEKTIRNLAEFNQQLIDTTGGLIVVFDHVGVIQRFNHTAEELLGWKESEVIGKKFFEVFLPPGRKEEVAGFFPLIHIQKPSLRFEDGWLDRQGVLHWIAWANSPILEEDGSVKLLVCTGMDRTPEKLAEQRILDLNDSLERRVEGRTRELQDALEELDSFSYTVSHDLRAPLRAIDGFSKALLEEAGDVLAPDTKGYLDRIRAATTRMARLIDDLLELSRSSRLPLRKASVDASLIAREILDGYRNLEPSRALSGRVEPGLVVDADPVLLRTILENLLGNAWKYTSTRPESIIEVSSMDIDGRRWIQVRDNGVGFSMDHAGKLFGTFQRLHSDPRFVGTGIGLATVRKLAERHGGAVAGEGIPDQGATFRFTLEPPAP